MKENLDLLKPVMPVPGTKGYLVLEHLTSADLRDRGQEREAESVIRLSLCESKDGNSLVPVYELLLDDRETDNPVDAHAIIRTWAAGFMLGARYAGLSLGLTIKPTRPI